jgi:dTDP-4-amino-4,6-dideoxygalactose transaminase
MERPERLPFNRPFLAGRELEYIRRAIESEGRLAGNGAFSKLCHQWLERHLGCLKALLTHSGTHALEMAALLADIRPGDEVIMPSFTFVSTANAFVLRGGVPVFVDIRQDTLNMDERLVEAAVTDRTRAIVPVHYGGAPCRMDAILDTAGRHGLVVIEDAAQAFGSRTPAGALGTLGHLGCLSFHETKNVICGEGGALLISDPSYAERAEILWEKGTNRLAFFRGLTDKYTWVDIGSSFLPSELEAAFLYAQLEQAEAIVDRRKKLWSLYREALAPLEEEGLVRLPPKHAPAEFNGHLFWLLTQTPRQRDGLLAHLHGRNILAVFHYIPLHSSPAGRRYGRPAGPLPVTEAVSARLLRLPLFHELREEDVHRVVEAVTDFFH